MFDALTIGSITTDLFLQIPEMEEETHVTHQHKERFFLLPAGAKIQVQNIIKSSGGGAANSAVGLSALGLKTSAFGVIGNDENGHFIAQHLQKHNVDTSHLIETKDESSFSVILTASSGKRTVLHHRTTTSEFDAQTLSTASGARGLYISHLYEQAQEMFFEIPNWKNKHKGTFFWNPGATQFKTGLNKFKKLFPHVDYLLLNREEAEKFTDILAPDIPTAQADETIRGQKIEIHQPENTPESMADVREIGKKLLSYGIKNVLITDGRRGAQFFTKDQHLYIPVETTPPVCTLGAGDAFAVGVMGAFLHGKNTIAQMQWGSQNATSVVNEFGAQKGLLSLNNIAK